MSLQLVTEIEREYMKKEVPDFRSGDTVSVAVRIVEGDKERIQNFEGVVIARSGGGMSEIFTVRRVSFGVGMERTFMLHSPRVETIKVVRHGPRASRQALLPARSLRPQGPHRRHPPQARRQGQHDHAAGSRRGYRPPPKPRPPSKLPVVSRSYHAPWPGATTCRSRPERSTH